ncbi:MAG: hypothetical protein NC253_04365 [Ruminococcus sp.]|nr:hypothetical protein [Ruminococcus sp.]
MKIYTMIGGVNGSGKSSLTGVLLGERNDLGTVVDTDSIAASLGGSRIKGGKRAVSIIEDCLQKGVNFTQETTLSGRKPVQTAIRAKELDYFVRLYYVGVSSAEESLLRIENRVRRGGHGIPEEDVRRRFSKRFEDLKKILPYCGEAYFYDNENGFVQFGEYKNGKIILWGENIPQWLKDFKKFAES